MLKVEIRNGQVQEIDEALSSGRELLEKLSLKNPNIVGLKVDGQLFDLQSSLPEQGDITFVDAKSPEAVELMRHSCAHVLAQAVKRLYPKTQVTIGPVIENGFYYDFAREKPFLESDLPEIEAEMKKIISENHAIERENWPVEKAIEYFSAQGEHYKCEIIRDLQRDEGVTEVGVYTQGEFKDLCRGPHLPRTGLIGDGFALSHVAGAYWRGDEKNAMLSRVYGLAFGNAKDLRKHLAAVEEAKKRDHRRLGAEMGLFSFHPEAPASPFFHPPGAAIYASLQDYLRRLNRSYGFEDVISPLIMSSELWKASGHYENYRENMYFTNVDERPFAVKPMNCPGHCLIYAKNRHSYRELPMRVAEFGRVHRHERSGVTGGLFRVRSFVQDDAHVFCTEGQVLTEVQRILQMIDVLYRELGFDYFVELSTRPEKRLGSDAIWDKAEGALKQALELSGLEYKLNPGDGAFYGPKIDVHLKDSLSRSHQCGTIQLDFSMPERFELEYSDAQNGRQQPVMIHRAIAGSLERFMGILIEHFAGAFPAWLAPWQALVISVGDSGGDYAQKLGAELKSHGIRCLVDSTSDNLGAKIKKYRPLKAPYMLIVGQNEADNKTVSIRERNGSQKQGLEWEPFSKSLLKACELPVVKAPKIGASATFLSDTAS